MIFRDRKNAEKRLAKVLGNYSSRPQYLNSCFTSRRRAGGILSRPSPPINFGCFPSSEIRCIRTGRTCYGRYRIK